MRREVPAKKGDGHMTTTTDYAALYAQADQAGKQAAEAATPVPMIVGEEISPFGGTVDYSKPTYYVADGVCGFAWVTFKGNTGWGRWAKKTGKATKAYGGGMQIRVSGYGQSLQRKEAYASAFASVLREAGVTAYPQSRMD